ncbi:MAG: LPS export ABC transporter periplasmic protein LptC [Steroidobacteraceae bacterium]|nr:LPS export ABC transporter periplasmic protein LptC [Steroidobacteraceae bacterium]
MKEGLRRFARPLGTLAVIAVIALAYFLARASRGEDAEAASSTLPPDPGYAARDAEVIETGYDGRERYRLNAKVIRQQIDSSVIDLEQLEMDYHPGAQAGVPGEKPASATDRDEVWHLRSDSGQVRADGDDVELVGNVQVTGPAPGTGAPISLETERMRINTPTEFIETDERVTLQWSGYELVAKGMKADLKAGTLRLESEVHGEFSPK